MTLPLKAARPENVARRPAVVLEIEIRHPAIARRASRVPTTMTRSGSSIGRPRIRTALTNVKTVALTPMPRASAMTATAVNQRSLTSSRTANRMSCQRFIVSPWSG